MQRGGRRAHGPDTAVSKVSRPTRARTMRIKKTHSEVPPTLIRVLAAKQKQQQKSESEVVGRMGRNWDFWAFPVGTLREVGLWCLKNKKHQITVDPSSRCVARFTRTRSYTAIDTEVHRQVWYMRVTKHSPPDTHLPAL